MKRKVLTLVLTIMVSSGVFAQGYPVIDITSIIAAVENGYTMVQQLQAMYNNLKVSYDQLQQQIKNYESFDFYQLDAKDPLGSWSSIGTYANRMLTYEKNIQALISKKDIKVGNSSYSLADVFTTPMNKTMQSLTIGGSAFNLTDPFEIRLSPEEKDIFHQMYGMGYGNYARIKQMGQMLQRKAAEVIGYSNNLQENLAEDRERLGVIVEDLFGSESTIQQQQINNAVMSIMAQDVKTQADLLGNIAQQLAMNFAQAQVEKLAREEEMNMNDPECSEGFIKMLNETPSSGAFK
jgi:phage gp16-like protein